MSEEGKQEKSEYIKQYKKIYLNNVLKKRKENNELKSVEVDVVTNFIEDEIVNCRKRNSDAEV